MAKKAANPKMSSRGATQKGYGKGKKSPNATMPNGKKGREY